MWEQCITVEKWLFRVHHQPVIRYVLRGRYETPKSQLCTGLSHQFAYLVLFQSIPHCIVFLIGPILYHPPNFSGGWVRLTTSYSSVFACISTKLSVGLVFVGGFLSLLSSAVVSLRCPTKTLAYVLFAMHKLLCSPRGLPFDKFTLPLLLSTGYTYFALHWQLRLCEKSNW